MYIRKPLNEMTLKDDFMFSAVMMKPENCKPMLERILGINIGSVTVDREKSIVFNPDYRGIRLDVLATDENNTHYNVEMQVADEHNLPLRSRYYHSQMDMELLEKGLPYQDLPACLVIFICDFDPFKKGLFCYTVRQRCVENGEIVDDGTMTIFLSTQGKNRDGISPKLLNFLEFLHKTLEESQKESEDPYIQQLQESVREIKHSREMGARYMLFTELLKDEFKSGYSEGEKAGYDKGERIGYDKGEKAGYDKGKMAGEKNGKIFVLLHILSEKGPVTEQLQQQLAQADSATLDSWIKSAIESADPEEFQKRISK